MEKPLEQSDLKRLKLEILSQQPEAALPCNLPDEWLRLLARNLEMFLQEQDEGHGYLSAPLAIVLHILLGKNSNKTGEIQFLEEELFEYLQDLRIEIALEIVRRSGVVVAEAASIETIFTNRFV